MARLGTPWKWGLDCGDPGIKSKDWPPLWWQVCQHRPVLQGEGGQRAGSYCPRVDQAQVELTSTSNNHIAILQTSHIHTDNSSDFLRPSINAIISKYSGEATGGNTGNEIEERGKTASRVEATLNVSSKDSPYALIDTYFPGIFSLLLCVWHALFCVMSEAKWTFTYST